MPSAEELLEQTLTGRTREEKRAAFLALIASADWRLVLAPHVISQQFFSMLGVDYTDDTTFQQAAQIIATSEEKIQRVLEMLGSKGGKELLNALARHMGHQLVEHTLAHYRTAKGERAVLLQQALYQSDPLWVKLPAAKRVIRKRLRRSDPHRAELLNWLADAGILGEFLDEIHDHLPSSLDEWHALGKAKIHDVHLIHLALGSLGKEPDALAYLLHLNPVPVAAVPRMMAAARTDWLVNALEMALVVGLYAHSLLPLVELGIRLGGRPMAMAMTWLNAARLGKELLGILGDYLVENGERSRLADLFWLQRRSPSANRALEEGRRGKEPDSMDAATLVRQLRGEKVVSLVQEILTTPRPQMMQSVLRPLCGVNPLAAREVIALSKTADPPVVELAQEALSWADVDWHGVEPPQDVF